VVKAAVQVGANSRVVDCTVVETSGSAILDEAACKSLRRSSFNAARDRAGQPIDSIFERTVRFEDPTKTVQPN
jgi:protein TonB